jgi:VIT1/CCC1 family predicted Fe2+/Mn2+ transporter
LATTSSQPTTPRSLTDGAERLAATPASTHVREIHRSGQVGWLRAAVLGANDGLISTSSLAVGVAAATPDRATVLLAALAGTVAGALSMAAGEYVSVSSQADTEAADLATERMELRDHPEYEHAELAGIYRDRGLTPDLADQVATQLMSHDALGAHARDELGFSETSRARPLQAALASAAAFAFGAAPVVILSAMIAPASLTAIVGGSSLALLAVLGALAARLGGAPMVTGAIRMMFWGTAAMVCTSLVGRLFGVSGGL